MMKIKKFKVRGAIFFIILITIITGCVEPIDNNITFEDSQAKAELFVLNSPTYKFNGNNLAIIDSNTLQCENCYIFIFKFDSAYSGYGLRNSHELIEKKVVNVISIIVQKGKVIQATINNEWNEILQRNIVDYEIIDGNRIDRIPTYYCSEPRPNSCTKENDPVCSSVKKDFNNGCLACSQNDVKWYTKGKCDIGEQQKVIKDLNQGKITKDSGPVIVIVGLGLLN